MANRCCCSASPACRAHITSADLAELLYVQGLDANLCTKFQRLNELFQFRDCENNIIEVDSQIVTCDEFADQLCQALADFESNGAVTLDVTQVVGADCQLYTIPETQFTVTDTNSIDLTTSGSYGHNLVASVKISSEAGNILIVNSDGLYVPATEVPATACEQLADQPTGSPVVLGTTAVLGTDCEFHVVPETVLVANDSSTIDFTQSGSFGHTFTGEVIISELPGNQITIETDGIFVPTPTEVDVCDTLAALPTVGSITPGVTALIGKDCNAYTIPAVPGQTPITPVDTDCINLTVSGTDNHTLQVDVVVNPSPFNILECTEDGLFVQAGQVTLSAVDTSCINTTVANVGGDWTISAAPILDPDPCNEVKCNAGGLFVREGPTQWSSQVSVPNLIPIPGITLTAPDTFDSGESCLAITSISECSPGILHLVLTMPGYTYQPTIVPARVRLSYTITLDIPGNPSYDPPTTQTFTQTTEGMVVGGEIAVMQSTYSVISFLQAAPSAGEICIQALFEVLEGEVTIIAGVIGAGYTVLSAMP